jgi:hypothetical protein
VIGANINNYFLFFLNFFNNNSQKNIEKKKNFLTSNPKAIGNVFLEKRNSLGSSVKISKERVVGDFL